MKTCLFGGTFDPPHFGHLIVAQTIFEAEHFDKIVFIPAHIPPHKKGQKISSLELRLEMLKIAIKNKPNYVCLVPEKRKEITTEGGLNINKNKKRLSMIISELNKKKYVRILFIKPI